MYNIDLTNAEEIIEFLKECDDSYFNSDVELISDAEYDNLKKVALKLSPKDPYFVTTGSDVRAGKTKLPFAMNGLNQAYENEVEPWVIKNNASKNDIVITAKLDGVSVLLVFADKDGDGDAEFQIAYSRGNTVEGADITRHVKQLNFPKVIKGYSKFAVRAEIIQKDTTFRTKYANKFSSARALVSGKMNASITDASILADIDLIAYTVVDQSKKPLNKVDSLAILKQNGFDIPFTEVVKGSQLNDQFLISTIEQYKKTSAYELDGIVLTDNDSGESVKYKIVDKNSIKTTMFKSLEMDVSKWFTINPRISMLPVTLNDTTVSFCTAWNLNFIYVNKVGPGSELTITKAGQTIPFLIKATPSTVSNYDQWFTEQLDNFVGKDEWKWNDTHVNVVLKNPNNHPIVKFKQVLDFFESLKVDQLKENTLAKIFDHYNWNNSSTSYEKCIETIFDLTEQEWENIIGKNGLKINESLHRRLGSMKLETLLGSLNYCGYGFGIRRAKQLLEQIDQSTLWNLTERDISALYGFDDKTAGRIAEGLPKVLKFLTDNTDYITILKETKTSELKDVTVVFTGFRDDAFAAEIEQKGGKVSTGVSKKTTYLIAADPSSSTGKPEKARSLGVKVVGVDEFKAIFDL